MDTDTANIAVAAFLLMVLPVFGLNVLRRRRGTLALRALAGIGLAGAACCVVVGIVALAGGDHRLGAIASGGVASRAAAYWPYGLILIGTFWTVVYAATQWSAGRR